MLKRIGNWLGVKTGVVGANDYSPVPGAKDFSPVRPAGAPSFEPLEPRLLLNADLPDIQPLLTCGVPSPEQAICVDLDRQDGSIQADLSPVLTIDVAPCNQTDQPASTPVSLEDAAPQVGRGVVAESASPDTFGIAEDDTAGAAVPSEQDITLAADASSVEIRGPPGLPGMRLVDPDISNWQSQIVYLDFDGQEDVTYHGPVTVGPFDVAAFQAPDDLAGQERTVITEVMARLERTFAGSGIIFTTERPSGAQPYSTIYVGGDDLAFAEYGSFLGLAEQVDRGNRNPCDTAFVFVWDILREEADSDRVVARLADVVRHELGHLLGYEHVASVPGSPLLSNVAADITVISPNGGEVWNRGTSRTITWEGAAGIANVRIQLIEDGTEKELITGSTPNDGSHIWNIPVDGFTGNEFRVRVADATNYTVRDDSDGLFTLNGVTPTGTITVTTPDGGEVWQRNTSQTIRWDRTGTIANVRIQLMRNDIARETITDSTPNTGSFAWSIPSGGLIGSDFRVRIADVTNYSNHDDSDGLFTLTGTSASGTITVTTPNGGESWSRDTSQTIRWSSTGTIASVRIELLQNGAVRETIAGGTANNGSFSWSIPSDEVIGTSFKIRVSDVTNYGVRDDSDNVFELKDPGSIVSGDPVYRFWSSAYSDYFYTISEATRDEFISNSELWTYEGVAYHAFADDSQGGVAPVYQFWSQTWGIHFYTIRQSERDKLVNDYSHVFAYEGIVFYVYPEGSQPPDASPVYGFWSSASNGHFYTASELERDKFINDYSDVWTYEGIRWYADQGPMVVDVELELYRVSDASGDPNTSDPGIPQPSYGQGDTVRVTLAACNHTGQSIPVSTVLSIRGSSAMTVVYDSHRVGSDNATDSPLSPGETDYYSFDWQVPADATTGTYAVGGSLRWGNDWYVLLDTTSPGAGDHDFVDGWTTNAFDLDWATGGLLATAYWQVGKDGFDQEPVRGAEVILYQENASGDWGQYGVPQPTYGSGHTPIWSGLPVGGYNLRLYYHGEYWAQLWDQEDGAVQVQEDSVATPILQRDEPFGWDFRVMQGGTDITGGTVPIGTALHYEVDVMNDTTAGRNVRVTLWVDRDQASPYDYSALSTSLGIAAGGERTFTFSDTVNEVGTHCRSLQVETQTDDGWVKTDGWAWTPAVTAFPTGSLQPIAYWQAGEDGQPPVPVDGAEVVLYQKNASGGWDERDRRPTDANGQTPIWSELPVGGYNLELQYHGEYWARLWDEQNGAVQVQEGAPATPILQRDEPHGHDFRVMRSGTDITGGTVPIGTALQYEVDVANKTTAERNVRVTLWVDRDQASPYDYSHIPAPSESWVIAAGATRTLAFSDTVNEAGTHHRSFQVDTWVEERGQWVKTDGWAWSPAINVQNHGPTASRGNPSETTVSVFVSTTQSFTVHAYDQDGNLAGVEWCVDFELQETHSISGLAASDSLSWTFDNIGTHSVQAYVFDSTNTFSSPCAAWTVEVKNPHELVIEGQVDYVGTGGETRAARHIAVEVWEKQVVELDYLLARSSTNDNGEFEITQDINGDTLLNVDAGWFESGTRDIYFKFLAENGHCWVAADWASFLLGAQYVSVTDVAYDVEDIHSVERVITSGLTTQNAQAWGIPGFIYDAAEWLKDMTASTWERDPIPIAYPYVLGLFPVDLSGFNPQFDMIFLEEDSGPQTVYHEYGHAVHFATRGDSAIKYDIIRKHSYGTVSNAGHAFTEGWAEFFSDAVWLTVSSQDRTSRERNDYWRPNAGEKVEGAVASILYDLWDGVRVSSSDYPDPDDAVDSLGLNVWQVMLYDQPDSMWNAEGNDDFYSYWNTRYDKSREVDEVFIDHGIAVDDDDCEDNDSLESAHVIPGLDTVLKDLILADEADWYRFTAPAVLGAGSCIQLRFDGFKSSIEAYLYNSTYDIVGESDFYWEIDPDLGTYYMNRSTVQIPQNQPPGDYYIKVVGVDVDFSPCYDLILDIVSDDGDGMAELEEMGPAGDNLDYDGNDDGLPDWEQANVCSFHSTAGAYLTLVSAPNKPFRMVETIPEVPAHRGIELPYGLFAFEVGNVQENDDTVIQLYVPEGMADAYYKYGPTRRDGPTDWYDFAYDVESGTGAEIAGNAITLHFKDGQRGDSILTPDNRIIDPGGPVVIDYVAPFVTVHALNTNDPSPALTGTVDDPMAAITVRVAGHTYTAANNGDGTWTLPDDAFAPLDDGRYDVVVQAVDPAGNIGADGSIDELTVDTTAPVVTVNSLTTTAGSPELTGTVNDPTAAVAVTVAGHSYAAAVVGATWTLAAGTITPELAAGTYDVAVTAADAAGNVGTAVGMGGLIIRTGQVQVAVDSLVRTTLGSTRYDLRTGRTSVLMTITNVSQTVIRGPLWVVITSISDPGVTLAGGSGITPDNYLYVDVSSLLSGGRLEPGQSVSVWLSFNNPWRRRFNFLYSIRGII